MTIQEVKQNCKDVNISMFDTGYLEKCSFLMENTDYSMSGHLTSYWIENPSISLSSMYINSSNRSFDVNVPERLAVAAVRPVIEVSKTRISY